MNITLRKGQKVDVTVPVSRFPTFTSTVTLLGQNIPTGVYLDFDAPTTSPSAGEAVKFTIETTANFNGGTFQITGNPAPSIPLEVILEVNTSVEQYDITIKPRKDTLTGDPVSGFNYQVLDPLTGTVIAQGASSGADTQVRFFIPTNYSRVTFIANKTGFNPTNHTINLVPTTKVMVQEIAFSQKFNTVSLTTTIQAPAFTSVPAGSTDTVVVKSMATGEEVYRRVLPTTLQNPIAQTVQISLPATVTMPFDAVVTVTRTGFSPYLANVRYTALGTGQSLGILLSATQSGPSGTTMQFNYISAGTANGVGPFNLSVTAVGMSARIVPSNYENFQYTNIVPQKLSGTYTSGKYISPKFPTYVLYNEDLTSQSIANNGSVSYVPANPSQSRVAAITYAYTDNSKTPPYRTILVVGRRVITSNIQVLVPGLQTLRAFSDPACTQLVYEEPLGYIGSKRSVPFEGDKLYVQMRVYGGTALTGGRWNEIVREVSIAHHPEGAHLEMSYENLPMPNPFYNSIDMNSFVVNSTMMFNFDAVSTTVNGDTVNSPDVMAPLPF